MALAHDVENLSIMGLGLGFGLKHDCGGMGLPLVRIALFCWCYGSADIPTSEIGEEETKAACEAGITGPSGQHPKAHSHWKGENDPWESLLHSLE